MVVEPSRVSKVLGPELSVAFLGPSKAARLRITAINRNSINSRRCFDPLDFVGPSLSTWSSGTASSLLSVSYGFNSRFNMRVMLGDVAEHIDQQNVPVIWAFKLVSDEGGAARGISVGMTPTDVLKSLILQTLQSPQANITMSQLETFRKAIQRADTEADWYRLLSSALDTLRLVYIIIDNEVAERSPELSDRYEEISWSERLAKTLEEHRKEGTKTIVKLIIAGYRPAMRESQWLGTAILKPVVRAKGSSTRRRRRVETNKLASFIRPHAAELVSPLQHDDNGQYQRKQNAAAATNVSSDDTLPRPPGTSSAGMLSTKDVATRDEKLNPRRSAHLKDGDHKRPCSTEGSSVRPGSFSSESTGAVGPDAWYIHALTHKPGPEAIY